MRRHPASCVAALHVLVSRAGGEGLLSRLCPGNTRGWGAPRLSKNPGWGHVYTQLSHQTGLRGAQGLMDLDAFRTGGDPGLAGRAGKRPSVSLGGPGEPRGRSHPDQLAAW